MTPSLAELAELLPPATPPLAIEPLHGDGSARRFYRVHLGSGSRILLEGPDPDENAAYVRIAGHLAGCGIRVPQISAVVPARGWVLVEDLGDRSLYAAAREASSAAALRALYEPVVDLLAAMQVRGAAGFELSTGFAPAAYGPELMVAGEGQYFVTEMARGLLGLTPGGGYRQDLVALAGVGGRARADYFLHRDFQSRNVHLTPDGPALIDFQGARPGPLAYDVAALLLDPYVGLPAATRRQLLSRYRERVRALEADPEGFDDAWWALGTFRLLQALGAFAKLGGRLGKPGFLEHIGTGLDLLAAHFGDRGRRELPHLWQLVSAVRRRWHEGSRPES